MNKVYKLKFSRALNQLIVVSELADNREVKATSSTRLDLSALQPAVSVHDLISASKLLNPVLRLGAGTSLVAVMGSSAALTGHQVVSGNVEVVKNGSVTTITNSPSSIINWESFNIGKDEIVKFIQQSANSAVLNRVLGKQASEILGSLQSNGRVFLINPNGILFGKSATVNVAELVASTLDITNEDFTAGRYVFNQEKDTTIASVLNQGMIQVNDDGSLALIGGNVLNNGVLQARNGSIYLLAGKSITIVDLDNPLISYKVAASNRAVNLGQIISKRVNMLGAKVAHGATSAFSYADIFTAANTSENTDLDIKITARGEVELFAGSIADQFQTNQQSNAEVVGEKQGLVVSNATIAVNGNGEQAGKVRLLGDYVATEANSAIYAAGGTVFVGGDTQGKGTTKLAQVTRQQQTSVINVSNQGNAGTAIVWGNYLYADGRIEAKSVTGKGGFVETSGKGLRLAETLVISTESNKGRAYYGTWLIDPTNIFVYHNESDRTSASATSEVNGSNNPTNGYGKSYKPATGDDLYVKDEYLAKALNATSVNLQATNNISFLSGTRVDHQAGGSRTLTLKATNITLTNSKVASDIFSIEAVNFTANTSVLTITDSSAESKFNVTSHAIFNNSQIVNGKIKLLGKGTGRYQFENNSKIDNVSSITSEKSGSDSITYFNLSNSYLNYTGSINVGAKDGIYFTDSFVNQSQAGIAWTRYCTSASTSSIVFLRTNYTTAYFKEGNTNLDLDSAGSLTVQDSNFTVNWTLRLLAGNASTAKVVNSNLSSVFISQVMGGNVEITGSNISYKGSFFVELTANTGNVVSTNSNFSAKGVRFLANASTQGNVTIQGNKFDLTNKDGVSLLINTSNALNITGSDLKKADGALEFDAKTIDICTSCFTSSNSTTEKIFLLGRRDNSVTQHINMSNVVISGGSNFNVLASSASYNISNGTNVTLKGGWAKFSSETGKTNVTDSKLDAYTVEFHSNSTDPSKGGLYLNNTTLNSVRRATELFSKTNITIENNSSLKATNLFVVNAAKNLNVTNSKFESTAENVTISGAELVNFTDSNATAYKNIYVRGKAIKFNASNFTSKEATTGGHEISVGYSNSASGSLNTASVEITNSNFTTEGTSDVNFHGTTSVTLTGGSITSKRDINISSPFTGTVKLERTTANAERSINITSRDVQLKTGTALTAKTSFHAQAANDITLEGAKVTSEGNATLNASNDISLSQKSKLKGANVFTTAPGTAAGTVASSGGSVTLNDSELEATTGEVNVSAYSGVYFYAGSNVSAGGNINVNSVNQGIDFTETNISSTGGDIKLQAKGQISSLNSNVSGSKVQFYSTDTTINVTNLTITASSNLTLDSSGTLTLTGVKAEASNISVQSRQADAQIKTAGGSTAADPKVTTTLNATSGFVKVQAKTDVTLGNGTNLLATGDITVKSETATVTAYGTNITTSTGTAKVESPKTILLSNTNITGGKVEVNSTLGSITLTNSNLTSTASAGYTKINANQAVAITNSKVISAKDVVINSECSTVTLTGTNITAVAGHANVTALDKITATNSNITGDSVEVNSTQAGVALNNSTVKSTDPNGATKVEGKTEVTLGSGTKVEAKKDVVVSSQGTLTATNATVSAETGTTTVKAQGTVTLNNGTKISATNDVTVKSETSTLTATGTNITSTAGKAKVEAQEKITLTNSNVSGSNVEINSTMAGVALNNSTVKSTDPNGSTKVEGKTDVTLGSRTKVEAKKDVVVSSQGTLTATNASVSAETGTTTVKAKTAVSLENGTKVSATGEVSVKSETTTVTAVGTNITSTAGNAKVEAPKAISLTNTNISGLNLEVKSTGEGVTVTNSTLGATAPTGSATITAEKAVNIGVGSKVGAKGTTTLESKSEGITVTGANITSTAGVAKLVALKEISLTNANISGANVQSTAAGLSISGNSTVEATTGAALVQAQQDVNLGNGAKILAQGAVTVKSENAGVTAIGTNISSTAGTARVEAPKDISLTNSNISGASVEVNSTSSAVTVNNSTLGATSESGSTKVSGETKVELGNGSKVGNKGDTTLESREGKLEATGANLVSDKGITSVKAKTDLTLTNSNVSGAKTNVVSTEASLTTAGSRVEAKDGTAIVKAKTNLNLQNGTSISANGEVRVQSETSSITAVGTNITSTGGLAKVIAPQTISLTNTNVSGAKVEVNSTLGAVTLDKSILKSTDPDGSTKVNAKQAVTLTNSKVQATKDVDVKSTHEGITATGTNITATTGTATLTAPKAISLNNSNISGASIEVNSTEAGVTVTNSTLDSTSATGSTKVSGKTQVELGKGTKVGAKGDTEVESRDGTLIATGATVSSEKGTATVKAKDTVTLDNTDVTGTHAKVESTEKGVTLTGNSTVEATAGTAVVKAKEDVILNNGSKVLATGYATVSSDTGAVTVIGSNITSTAGTATLTAPKAISLTNSNISGASIEVNSTEAGVTVTNSNLDSTSATGSTKVSGKTQVELGKGTKVGAKGDTTVESRDGTLTATGATVSSEKGTATVKAKDTVNLDNTEVTGTHAKVESTEKGVTLTGNSTVEATAVTAVVKAKEDINLNNGTKVLGTGDVTVASDIGAVTATGSNITSTAGMARVSAPKEVTISNSNISGASLEVSSTGTDGAVIVKDNSTLSATTGTATIKAKENVLLQHGTKVDSQGEVKVESSNASVSLLGTNISSATGSVLLKAKEELTLAGSNVSGASVELNSTNASVATTDKVAIKATKDQVQIKAKTEITLGNGTKVEGTTGVKVESLNSTLTVVGSNITSPTGAVSLKAREEIELNNSNISGASLAINSTNSAVVVTGNTSLEATKGEAVVKAKENILLENGSKVKAKQDLKLNSENASISALGANLTSTAGTVNITAKDAVTLIGTNVSGADVVVNSTKDSVTTSGNTNLVATKGFVTVKGDTEVILGNGTQVKAVKDIKVESPNGSTSVIGSNLTSTSGEVSIAAKENVTINNSNLTGRDLSLNAANGSLTTVNSSFNSENTATLNAKEDISLDKTKVQGGSIIATSANASLTTSNGTSIDAKTGNLNANAKKDIILGNGTKLNAGGDNYLAAQGNLVAAGANITAGGLATMTAKKELSLTNTNLSGLDVNLNADNLNLANSSVEAHTGTVNLVGDKAVNIGNGTKVQAPKDISVSSPSGSIAVTGSNLTSGENVSLVAKNNITLTNSNISGRNVKQKAGDTLKLADSNVVAKPGSVLLGGDKKAELENSKVKATGEIKVDSPNGSVAVKDTNLTAGTNVTVNAKEKTSLSNSNISGQHISAKGKHFESKDTTYDANKTVKLAGTESFNMDHDKLRAKDLIEMTIDKGKAKITNTYGKSKHIELPPHNRRSEKNNVWESDNVVDVHIEIPESGAKEVANELRVVNPSNQEPDFSIGNIVADILKNSDTAANNNPSASNPGSGLVTPTADTSLAGTINPNNQDLGSTVSPTEATGTIPSSTGLVAGTTGTPSSGSVGSTGIGASGTSGTASAGSGAGVGTATGNSDYVSSQTSSPERNAGNGSVTNSVNSGNTLSDKEVARNTVRGVNGKRLSAEDFEKFAEEEAKTQNNSSSVTDSVSGSEVGSTAGSSTDMGANPTTRSRRSAGSETDALNPDEENYEGKVAKARFVISSDDKIDNEESDNTSSLETATEDSAKNTNTSITSDTATTSSNDTDSDSSSEAAEATAANVESSTASFNACTIHTTHLYDKYNVTKEDREKLTLDENIKKYNISDADTREYHNNCNDNDYNKLQNQINKISKTNKKK